MKWQQGILQISLKQGKFVQDVSVLLNNNIDEGLSFGVRGLNNSQQIIQALNKSQDLPDGWLNDDVRMDLERIYPDDEDIYTPFQAGAGLLPASNGTLGVNDRRSCTIFGDLLFVGQRRYAAQQLARYSSSKIY